VTRFNPSGLAIGIALNNLPLGVALSQSGGGDDPEPTWGEVLALLAFAAALVGGFLWWAA
jgi:hypothetical protein